MIDQDIFEDGWREPGDDVERLAGYILFVIGGIGGVAGLWLCSSSLLHPLPQKSDMYMPPALSWFGLITSLLLAVGPIYMLLRERKHWNLRKLTLDKVFAGIFCFWIAVGMIGYWLMVEGAYQGAFLFPVAIAGWGVTLLAGLPIAFKHKLFPKKKVFDRALVLRRFAIDDKGTEHDNYVSPFDFGLKGYVTLKHLVAGIVTVPATYATYDLADPKSIIYCKVVNGKLVECRRLRR